MELFEVCCERAFQIRPITLISATEYLGLPTEVIIIHVKKIE